MSGPYDLRLGDIRDNWGQRVLDRLLEQQPDAVLVEWEFLEERVREVERMPEYQLRVNAPDGRVFVWAPSPIATWCCRACRASTRSASRGWCRRRTERSRTGRRRAMDDEKDGGTWRWVRFHKDDAWQVGRISGVWVGLTNISGPILIERFELGPVVPSPSEIEAMVRIREAIGALPDGVSVEGAVEVVARLHAENDELVARLDPLELRAAKLEDEVRRLANIMASGQESAP